MSNCPKCNRPSKNWDGPELARILREVARRVDETIGLGGYESKLTDSNGNWVGKVTITK